MLGVHTYWSLKLIPYAIFFTLLYYLSWITYGQTEDMYLVVGAFFVVNLLLTLLIAGFFASLIYFYKPWRERYYPKYNAVMIDIIFLGLRTKRFKITPDMLFNNRFIIPRFNNILLEYEMTGDFNKYAQTIDVIALKKLKKGCLVDDPFHFKVTFYFNDVIKNGELKVKYI